VSVVPSCFGGAVQIAALPAADGLAAADPLGAELADAGGADAEAGGADAEADGAVVAVPPPEQALTISATPTMSAGLDRRTMALLLRLWRCRSLGWVPSGATGPFAMVEGRRQVRLGVTATGSVR
jgi:hypothetical protein